MRSLSNPEFAQFMQDEQAIVSSMWPGQHQVVNWGGMSVLILIGPNPIEDNGQLYPDVYLSDVSDAPQLQAMLQPGYNAPPQSMLDTLPQAIQDTIASEAATAGALINSAGQSAANILTGVAGTVGAAAGAAVNPLLSGLAVPLVAAAVILFLIYKK